MQRSFIARAVNVLFLSGNDFCLSCPKVTSMNIDARFVSSLWGQRLIDSKSQ
jgi:hypothetical protein